MPEKEIEIIFIIRRRSDDGVSSYGFIGLLRGLSRCYRVGIPSYEGEENPKYKGCYCVPAIIPKKQFERVKGQAESYGLIVKEAEKSGF